MGTFSETWHMAYTIVYYRTTEFDWAKRDSHLAAYGGVASQRFEFIKVCMGASTSLLRFYGGIESAGLFSAKLFTRFERRTLRKSMYGLVFLLVMETHGTITRSNRVRSPCRAGKQQTIQHSDRISRFYSRNIRIIDFSSKPVAFLYKPL